MQKEDCVSESGQQARGPCIFQSDRKVERLFAQPMKSTHFNVFLTTAKHKTLFPIREVIFLSSVAVCKD